MYHSRDTLPVRGSMNATRGGVIGTFNGLGICRTHDQFSADDGNLHGVSAAQFVYSVAQLHGHTQTTPDGAAVKFTDLANADPVFAGPCVTAVIAPTQHDLRVAALAEVQAHAGLQIELEAVLGAALEIVLAGGKRPPRPQPLLNAAVVREVVQIERVDVGVLVVAHQNVALEKCLTVAAVYWDDADSIKTLNIVMEDSGEVVQHVGEETYYRVKATAPITNGQVVMFTGTVGASGGLLGAPATGLTATQNEYIMGVATQDIATNGWGYVTWFGEVKKINTTGGAEAWVDGQILYYNPAVPGGLTKFVPAAPNPKVIVASVVHAATNGILFVRPTFGSVLGATDSNVEITGLANGDLLQYDGVQMRWENVTPASVIAGASGAPVTKTTDFTVAAGETWLINNKSGSSCTVTLPSASTNTGKVLHFLNYQARTLVSASSNVVPLAGGAAGTAILQAVAGANATLVSDGTNWIMTQYDSNNSLEME